MPLIPLTIPLSTAAIKINYLLQFLGFTLTDAQKTQSLTDLVLTAPPSAVKHLGATIHSTPSMVSYSADLDATTGAVTTHARRLCAIWF